MKPFELTYWTYLEAEMMGDLSYLNPTDNQKAVDWFNNAQNEWGVQELVILAAEVSFSEIVDAYLPNEKAGSTAG